MDKPLSLENARKLITAHVCPVGEESVPLQDSLNRRPSCNLLTTIPVPHFCELVRTAIFALHGKRDAPGKGADCPGTGYYHQKKGGC